jgi:phospholipase C
MRVVLVSTDLCGLSLIAAATAQAQTESIDSDLRTTRKARDSADVPALRKAIDVARQQAQQKNNARAYEQLALLNYWLCEAGHGRNDENLVKQAAEAGVAAAKRDDIPFYYDAAQNFSMNDRYFASVLGPTFPNRSYLLAATSFGHLTTADTFPPPGGYKPITGTIFDLFDQNGVTWADYFQDAPQGGSFRIFSAAKIDPHFFPLKLFLAQAAGVPGLPPLASVSFIDPNFGIFGRAAENDEHPPTDIQRGQAFVSRVVNAVRNGPFWQDSVIFITYDEHGGYFDHVAPPPARQGQERTPDGISPGQCADLSNPPNSLQPGGGADCSQNLLSKTDTSVIDAGALCPEFSTNPTGPFPDDCASFDQLGVRVPLLAISPFSKPHYVSHTTGDHTSLLAFVEKRFLSFASAPPENNSDNEGDDFAPVTRLHLTKRDQHAHTLEDMFDFDGSPSLSTPVTVALPPAVDCTPK